MLHVFDFIREMTRTGVFVRITLAVLCGGVIGIEREVKHRAAGFRTHILICLGAAITTLTSQYLYLKAGYYTDIARLGAQVISGIGFIGAGAIIVTKQNRIRGLTTAAGLWACAIIGLACGAGFAECAVLATAIVIFAELLLIRLETRITEGQKIRRYYIEYVEASVLQEVLKVLKSGGVRMENLEISRTEGGKTRYRAIATLKGGRKATKEHTIEHALSVSGVVLAEEL